MARSLHARSAMNWKRLGWIALALGAVALVSLGGGRPLADLGLAFTGTPHERYAARLRLGWVSGGAAGRLWLERADASLRAPVAVTLPHRDELDSSPDAPGTAAVVAALRRGQRLVVETGPSAGRPPFVDVFRRDDEALDPVGHAPDGAARTAIEIRRDGDYVIRVQAALGTAGPIMLQQRVEPTLRLPVDGATVRQIRSFFGAPRDEGRREHAGIDIFARRGTRVLAASDGIVSGVGNNRLGGKVVWVVRPLAGEAHYYAHLDTQLVTVGARVRAGEVLGTVGNTGNARTTPPHLHFGIYAAGGAVDPLPYVAPARAAVAPHPVAPVRAPAGKALAGSSSTLTTGRKRPVLRHVSLHPSFPVGLVPRRSPQTWRRP